MDEISFVGKWHVRGLGYGAGWKSEWEFTRDGKIISLEKEGDETDISVRTEWAYHPDKRRLYIDQTCYWDGMLDRCESSHYLVERIGGGELHLHDITKWRQGIDFRLKRI